MSMARKEAPGVYQIGIWSVQRLKTRNWLATATGPGTIGDGSAQTFDTLAAAYLALTGEPMRADPSDLPAPTAAFRALKAPVRHLMEEARRRIEYFGKRDGKTIESTWSGLGVPSYYRPGVEAGLFAPLGGELPRVLNWYRLTKEGAAVYRQCFPEAGKAYNATRAQKANS